MTHDDKVVLSYRAKWDGDYLVVRAAIEPGWHTFVMDNKERQTGKARGQAVARHRKEHGDHRRRSEPDGPWLQSEPKDFSKPELRWYSWGFERDAVFATKAKRAGQGPAKVGIQGQACSGDICKNIDVEIPVPVRQTGVRIGLEKPYSGSLVFDKWQRTHRCLLHPPGQRLAPRLAHRLWERREQVLNAPLQIDD